MTLSRIVGSSRITTAPDPKTRTCARCGVERSAGGNNSTDCRNCRNKTSGEKQPDAHSTPCQERDPEVWFPDASDHDGQAYAKALCTACPVIVECLDYALSAGEQSGVWGGQSEDEIRALIERRKRKARAANRSTLPPEQIRTKTGQPVRHGSPDTYKRYGCGCQPCTTANTEAEMQRRARARAREAS